VLNIEAQRDFNFPATPEKNLSTMPVARSLVRK
jgi:hypothetical protein